MNNFWLDRALKMHEEEVLLLKPASNLNSLYSMMPPDLPAIAPDVEVPSKPEEFAPVVGRAHHLRITRLGLEAVLKAPRKYHRYACFVLFGNNITPGKPFWVLLRR